MQQELRPLPLGTSDIGTIIKHDFMYVDKTKLIYEINIKILTWRKYEKTTISRTNNYN